MKDTKLPKTTANGAESGTSFFEVPVREVFAKEIVEVFNKDKEVAEIARKFPNAADQVAPLTAWLKEKLKDK